MEAATPTLSLSLSPRRVDVLEIPVGWIQPDPTSCAAEFDADALQRLADNLERRGQLQPIRVRFLREAVGMTRYMIVSGERRWRAAQLAGLPSLTAGGQSRPGDRHGRGPGRRRRPGRRSDRRELRPRADLNPMEIARALASLSARQWSQRQMAQETGLSAADVTRALALLEIARRRPVASRGRPAAGIDRGTS